MNDFRYPAGIQRLEADRRMRRKAFSPLSQDCGSGSNSKLRSVDSRNSLQRASLKFMKVRVGRTGGEESRRVMRMGRWSELREVAVDQERDGER